MMMDQPHRLPLAETCHWLTDDKPPPPLSSRTHVVGDPLGEKATDWRLLSEWEADLIRQVGVSRL